jgi:uncharacterized sulfatase
VESGLKISGWVEKIRLLARVGLCGCWLFFYGGFQLVNAAPPVKEVLEERNQPINIVIIVADDMAYGDIGAYGATRIRTPNIDALAKSGLMFTNGYASANVCSPSRAGIMTGRYAIRSGLAWKVVTANDSRGLPTSEETLGELALRAGLETMFIGKWHLGNLETYSPLEHGFNSFYGVPHSNDMPDFALYNGREIVEQPVQQDTLTRRYTEAGVRFIESHAGSRPFLLFLSHTFPHIPLFASDEFLGKSDAGVYGDTVEELDWSVGEIMDALENAGALDNTLLIFTSDNGPFFEGSTGGLKGGKGTSWEAGYRVPLIVAWPTRINADRQTETIAMNIDFLPTIADALGLRPAAEVLDGRSLIPVFSNNEATIHDYLLYFNNERVVGARSQDWKYVTHAYYTGSLGAFEKFDELPGFVSSYDLLFDVQGMDSEAYSVAQRNPAVVERHKKIVEQARAEFAKLRTHDLETTYPE